MDESLYFLRVFSRAVFFTSKMLNQIRKENTFTTFRLSTFLESDLFFFRPFSTAEIFNIFLTKKNHALENNLVLQISEIGSYFHSI